MCSVSGTFYICNIMKTTQTLSLSRLDFLVRGLQKFRQFQFSQYSHSLYNFIFWWSGSSFLLFRRSSSRWLILTGKIKLTDIARRLLPLFSGISGLKIGRYFTGIAGEITAEFFRLITASMANFDHR